MNLGVALPAWMFSNDKGTAPLVLLGLVGGCILLPLGLMSWCVACVALQQLAMHVLGVISNTDDNATTLTQ
jgi:uncharacterized membrane protein YphA (DoxX/SURF4 family)